MVIGKYELLFDVKIGKCFFDVIREMVVYFFFVGEGSGMLWW